MLQRVRRVLAPAVVLVVAVAALAGCSSDADAPAPDGDPLEAVRAAVAAAQGTARFRVHVTIDADLFVATQASEGIVEPDGDQDTTVTTALDTAGLGDAGAAAGLEAFSGSRHVIVTSGAVYTSWPDGAPAGRDALPPGIVWVREDAEVDGGVPGDMTGHLRPRAFLAQLGEVDEVVEDRGTTEVGGEPARWVRIAAPDAGDDRPIPPGTTVDVAIGPDGTIRRVAFVAPGQDEAEGAAVRVIVDWYDHGVAGTVTAPPADVTVERSELPDS